MSEQWKYQFRIELAENSPKWLGTIPTIRRSSR
jgi:hypothetical protein